MTPRERERPGVERVEESANVRELQQFRFSGHEQTNSELNRRHTVSQHQRIELFEQFDVAADRRPGCERDKCRRQRHGRQLAQANGVDEIRYICPFSQLHEHLVVDRFDGARDHEATGVAQEAEHIDVTQDVFDLDCHVVGEARKLLSRRRSTMRRA